MHRVLKNQKRNPREIPLYAARHAQTARKKKPGRSVRNDGFLVLAKRYETVAVPDFGLSKVYVEDAALKGRRYTVPK